MIAGGSLTDIPAGQIGAEAGWLFRDGMGALSGRLLEADPLGLSEARTSDAG